MQLGAQRVLSKAEVCERRSSLKCLKQPLVLVELRSLGIPARPLATDLHLSKQPVTRRVIDKRLQMVTAGWTGCQGLEVGQSILPYVHKGRRGCAGDYRRRCATGRLRVCVSRLPTGMTVESPGHGWCHTMRNVPGPGKEEKQLLSHNRSTGACQKKIRQLLPGASTALAT